MVWNLGFVYSITLLIIDIYIYIPINFVGAIPWSSSMVSITAMNSLVYLVYSILSGPIFDKSEF